MTGGAPHDLRALADAVRTRRRSAARTTTAALDRIAAAPAQRLNAFIGCDPQAALADAAAVDALALGAGHVLAGVPVAVKDNICTASLPTTCGSRMLADYRSPYDATVVRRLRDAGAIIIGKTNLDEFAMGSSTETSAFGPTLNPHDLTRVPGGSSGGSAAAVAAGLVPAALGSETGGSVRQPAAFCGVVGMRPSYGRVSRYGLVAYASSLDQVGVFGRSVADAALLLQVIAGPDPHDATSATLPVPDLAAAAARAALPPVVGVPREYFGDELDPRVRHACEHALDALRAAGATVREVSLPHTRYAVPTYCVLAPAEASANLARFDGVHYGRRARDARTAAEVYERSRTDGFGAEVRRRIMLGTWVLSTGQRDGCYASALRACMLIHRDFEQVFAAGVDVVFTPTTPAPAFAIGEKTADPYAMYLSDVYTVAASLAGLPALSLPIGRAGGLPVGGQLIGARWGEATVVGAAAALEHTLESA